MTSDSPSCVGIDLGTTYAAVARLDERGNPETLINAEGDKLTPSTVLFETENVVVGKEALKAIATDAEDVAQFAKRDLGNRTFHKVVGGRQYPPEAIEAFILNKLRHDAEQQIGPVDMAVITVPAYFDEVRRKATQDAGYMAGLEVPTSSMNRRQRLSALDSDRDFYRRTHPTRKNANCWSTTWGGGTFDVTVMNNARNDFIALATDGDVRLGGCDFDMRLVDYVAEEFIRSHGRDPREDPVTAGRLWRECEDAKRTLSARTKTFIACDYSGKAIRVEVTRGQFDDMTRDLIDRTQFTTRQTLQAAGFTWTDIDHVLLVGGSTRIPSVVNMLGELTGKTPNQSVSADEAVAHGAALHAGIVLALRQGKKTPFSVKNINSHSLGVVATDKKTKRQRNASIIPRNTSLPVTSRRIFKTQKAGQKSVLVEIVEGESASPSDCSPIGRCVVRDLPLDLPANSPVAVYFQYEENGRLQITVQVPNADKQVRHEIIRENSLTQHQLDCWRSYIDSLQGSGGGEIPDH